MSAKFQLVFEDVIGSNFDIPVLKFRDTRNGKETPSFILDVKRSSSYTSWNIQLGAEKKDMTEAEVLFNEVTEASEYELVFESYRKLKLDGDMLSRLINSMIWLNNIVCKELGFSSFPEEEEKEKRGVSYSTPKKKAVVIIGWVANPRTIELGKEEVRVKSTSSFMYKNSIGEFVESFSKIDKTSYFLLLENFVNNIIMKM